MCKKQKKKNLQNSGKATKMLKDTHKIVNLLAGSLHLLTLKQLISEELIFAQKPL